MGSKSSLKKMADVLCGFPEDHPRGSDGRFRHIYYAFNLHGREAEVRSFGSPGRAKRWARERSEATGCSFVVTVGLEWYQRDRCTPCPHVKGGAS